MLLRKNKQNDYFYFYRELESKNSQIARNHFAAWRSRWRCRQCRKCWVRRRTASAWWGRAGRVECGRVSCGRRCEARISAAAWSCSPPPPPCPPSLPGVARTVAAPPSARLHLLPTVHLMCRLTRPTSFSACLQLICLKSVCYLLGLMKLKTKTILNIITTITIGIQIEVVLQHILQVL